MANTFFKFPHLFIPGTPARALEVMENFDALLDYLKNLTKDLEDYVRENIDALDERTDDKLKEVYAKIQALIDQLELEKKVVQLKGISPILVDNRAHAITLSGNTKFVLPTVTDKEKFHQMLVMVDMPIVYTIDLGTSVYFNDSEPFMTDPGKYTLIYEYDGSNWTVGALYKG